MAEAHPGATMEWAGNVVTIRSPGEADRTLTRRDFRTLREQARRSDPTPPAATLTPPPSDAHPLDGGGDAAPAAPRVGTGARVGAVPRVEQAVGRRVVTRSSVAEAFTADMLADLLRQFSQVLSDADGAGPAGVFSLSESKLLASLLHDQAIDLILRRFDGDVSRFRAGAAILIIIAGKGRVHLVAIQSRGGLRGLGANSPVRPIATVPASLPVAPDMPAPVAADVPAPWATGTAPAPVPTPEPEPVHEPAAPGGIDVPQVLSRASHVDRIFNA